jgi:phosphate transport system substrate-binding protein
MKNLISFIGISIALFSCGNSGKKGPTDTPTQGVIHIAADEAFAPIVAAEINAFHGLYPKAKIIPHYVTEQDAYRLLMADSVRLVISSRDFTEAERQFFKEKTIRPTSLKIATDAIGIVLHPENQDTLLKFSELKKRLISKDFFWRANSRKGAQAAPLIVLDKEGSSNEMNLMQLLGIQPKEIPHRIHYAGGDREVINFVNSHPEAIGFMGVNWISDSDDPLQMRFKSGVKVVALMPDSVEKLLASEPDLHSDGYFQPLQAYLAQGFYPLIRPVMVCSREARSGLGTGFIAWLSSDKGQRVILKAGLLPATMPIRVVKIKKDNDLTYP